MQSMPSYHKNVTFQHLSVAFALVQRTIMNRSQLLRGLSINDKNQEANLLEDTDDGEVGNHVDLVELLVDHEAEDAHHGGTAVVELDGALGELGLLVKGVPAEVEGTVAEVTGEFTGLGTVGGVLHDTKLEGADKEDDLGNSGLGDGVGADDGGDAVGVGVEGVASEVDGAVKVDAGAGDDLAEEGKLGDTAVLELDVTKALEAFLVSIVEEAEGIVEAEGLLGTELLL